MANALTLFEAGAVPAHVAAAQAEANITSKASVDALTFEGKVWQITMGGKKTKLLRADDDGEMQPVQIFTGIILDYTKQRGREYHKGVYDAKKPAAPVCWSEDGVTPNEAAPDKQASACAACPMSKKNSHVSADGKGTVACSQFRKIALIPAAKIGEFPPLRMRIKITSDWDATNAEKNAATGWYAFQQYLDLLVSKGVSHTALLPTKIKFDTSVAYPKLLFSPGKSWVPADMWEDTIKPLANSDQVKDLLAATYTPVAKTGTKALPEADDEETEIAPAIPAQAKPAKAALAAPVEDDEEDVATLAAPVEDGEEEVVLSAEDIAAAKRAKVAEATAATAKVAATKAGVKAAATKAAAVADVEEEDEAPAKPGKATAAAAAKPGKAMAAAAAKPAIAAPPDVAGMLASWDD